MIYLDHGATSLHKPPQVTQAVTWALAHCGNPGRGGHRASMEAAKTVFACRSLASEMFDCAPEQVVFTGNCTQGLNLAIRSLAAPGSRVLVSGFEHNAVTRTLHGLGAEMVVAGERLFDPEDTLESFEAQLRRGVDAAVFTHVSNVFGYILPVEQMAELCRRYGVPFAVDAAQSAGILPVKLRTLGADYIAMPGHKGLLGPQGTGLLLCARTPDPLLFGGTGSESENQVMPEELPERMEPGTLNVPGIAGLAAGMAYLRKQTPGSIARREQHAAQLCAQGLKAMGLQVFYGKEQGGTVSFIGKKDCELVAQQLAQRGIAVRAGLHCAPLAHRSAGTLETGTVRVSFGHDASPWQVQRLLQEVKLVDVM